RPRSFSTDYSRFCWRAKRRFPQGLNERHVDSFSGFGADGPLTLVDHGDLFRTKRPSSDGGLVHLFLKEFRTKVSQSDESDGTWRFRDRARGPRDAEGYEPMNCRMLGRQSTALFLH